MRRVISFLLLTAFLNFEVSYAFAEASPSSDRGDENGKNAKTQPSNNPSSPNSDKNSHDAAQPASVSSDADALTTKTAPKYSFLLSAEQEAFLDTLFAGAAVPPANIPVLENALGDVVKDSVVNILDLLRIRDITIGRPPAASAYERKEGDLNVDGLINPVDVNLMRDILLRLTGIPVVVDNKGATLTDGTTNVIIPAGVIETPTVLSVTKLSEEKVDGTVPGLDLDKLASQGIQFMGALKLSSPTEIPEIPIQLKEVFVGDSFPTEGTTGMYQVYPDLDGDSQPEFRLMDFLHLNADSTLVESDSIMTPEIAAGNIPLHKAGSLSGQPGTTFEIITNLVNDAEIPIDIFISVGNSNQGYSLEYPIDWIFSGSGNDRHRIGVSFILPPKLAGVYECRVISKRTGISSSPILLNIEPPVISGKADSILNAFFDIADTVFTEFDNFGDFHYSYLKEVFINRGALRVVRDSTLKLLTIPEREILAAYVSPLLASTNTVKKSNLEDPGPLLRVAQACKNTIDNCGNGCTLDPLFCKDCENILLRATEYLTRIATEVGEAAHACEIFGVPIPIYTDLCLLFVGKGLSAPLMDAATLMLTLNHLRERCDPFPPKEKTCRQRGGVEAVVEICADPTGNECVRNIICFHFNKCDLRGGGDDNCRNCENNFNRIRKGKFANLFFESSPLEGAIVTSNIRFIPTAVIDRNGAFSLSVFEGVDSLQLSVFDPKSGLFEPDYWHGRLNTIEGGVSTRIRGVFTPDTSVIRHTLSIGQFAQAAVNTTTPRHEYRFFALPSAVGSKLDVGLRAEEPLTFWLQDPSGRFVARDSSTDCGFEMQFTPTQSGTYLITVTYGVSGGDGPFTVGVNYAPCPSSPFLCGTIVQDTLYQDCFDSYEVIASTTVPANDTLFAKAGTIIQFKSGASIATNGVLQGSATPSKPIVLKPSNGSGQQAATLYPRANNKRQILKAEGKR